MLKALVQRTAARSLVRAVATRRVGVAVRARLHSAAASQTAAAARGRSSHSGHNGSRGNGNGKDDGRRARGFASAALPVLSVAAAAGAGAVAAAYEPSSDETQAQGINDLLDVFDAFEEGMRYQTGTDDRPKDAVKAVQYFRAAAEKGYAPAQYNLASLYLAGNGVEKDDAAAVRWLRRAVAQEDSEAQFLLGLLYSIGRGVEGGQNAQAAMELWQRAADMNYAPAQLRLAAAYKPRDATDSKADGKADGNVAAAALAASGYKVFQLPDSARSAGKCLYWLIRAARAGLPEAHVALQQHADKLGAAAGWTVGTFNQTVHTPLLFGDAQGAAATGAAVAPTNAAAAPGASVGTSSAFAAITAPGVESAAFSAAESPTSELHRLYQLGLSYRLAEGAQQQRAIEALRASAERGYAVAQCELAAAYALGVGVARDEAESERWFVAAAKQGLPTAMYSLGSHAMTGDDLPRAFDWFTRAAVRGEPQAQNNLGTMLCRGLAVDADAEAGVRWFAYAARRGMPEAMYALGQAYENGVGVDRDPASAAAWYSEAAGRGVTAAKAALQMLKQTGGAVGSPVTHGKAMPSASASASAPAASAPAK